MVEQITDNEDPNEIDFGSDIQDYSLIATTFEQGAHSDDSEESVFAPMSRTVQNSLIFGKSTEHTLSKAWLEPTNGMASGGFAGSEQGKGFNQTKRDLLKNCIPCLERVIALPEINPTGDLLAGLEAELMRRLAILNDILNFLKNFDIYGNFCNFLSLFNFMCIPDIQRLIALLSAMLADHILQLNKLLDLLMNLTAPMFTPILLAISTLLDQFIQLVLSPIECIISAINAQIAKLGRQLSPDHPLYLLRENIIKGRQLIRNKFNFYIEQLHALFGDMGASDASYLKFAMSKLTIIRLISFLVAIIMAMQKGLKVCSPDDSSPEKSELDNFFNNFINPGNSYNVRVDENNNLIIEDKPIQVDTTLSALPNTGNVVQFKGETIDISTIQNKEIVKAIENVQKALSSPIKKKMPCKFNVSVNEIDMVNQWIAEFDSIK